METSTIWNPGAWRDMSALQQPDWPDPAAVDAVAKELQSWPPLVFAGEARTLQAQLATVAAGEAFLLQAGDCAESFLDHSADSVRDRLKVLLQIAAVLTYAAGTPIVKVSRIAGQFAKPRSSPTEMVGGVEIPSFRGHIVNSDEPVAAARVPDPRRMLDAYHHAAATLNLLRAFTDGGFADLGKVHAWNNEFVASSPQGQRYEQIATQIDRALAFMRAVGIDTDNPALHQVDVWTSHEALLLEYEEALTRQDSLTGDWYDCSGHFLWIGERTRAPRGAHVAFLAGVGNPIGCKIGPTADPAEVVELCRRLNPGRVPGHLTLITRMGASKVRDALPPILEAVRDSGEPVIWSCDPMHGNTFTSGTGLKTRRLDDIVAEIDGFFAAHRTAGTRAGGVHLEITGAAVTECLGGGDNVTEADLDREYTTLCDPRLNAKQSLDLAFHLADLMTQGAR
ncbi:MAG TPA: 3-deoxy-7-phosphoheptulonate synthase class II [Actinomycetota bacterium]